MESELEILKARGFRPKPASTRPAPSEAVEASRAYQSAVADFNARRARIRSYIGHANSPDIAIAVQSLIDAATAVAGKIRGLAESLGRFPTCFLTFESGVAYYREIADTADEAYRGRLSELETISTSFRNGGPRASTPEILKAHEGFKRGHVISRHVDKTMAEFQTRFLQQNKERLSSLIGDRADEVVARAITLNQDRIDRAKEGEKLYVPIEEITPIGYIKERNASPRFTKIGRLIIFKDSSHPSGYRITSVELGSTETS